MKKLMLAVAGLMGVISMSPALAQVGAELNGARAEGVWGAELGVGYNFKLGPVSVRPVVGALIFKGDNDRYYMDNNGGNPRCRDSSNGQYADDWKCSNVDAKPYGRIEALYTSRDGFSLGVGARIRKDVQPYGTIAIKLAPKLKLKGNVGDDYYAAGLTFGF